MSREAPGDLETLRAFVNTAEHDTGHDAVATPETLRGVAGGARPALARRDGGRCRAPPRPAAARGAAPPRGGEPRRAARCGRRRRRWTRWRGRPLWWCAWARTGGPASRPPGRAPTPPWPASWPSSTAPRGGHLAPLQGLPQRHLPVGLLRPVEEPVRALLRHGVRQRGQPGPTGVAGRLAGRLTRRGAPRPPPLAGCRCGWAASGPEADLSRTGSALAGLQHRAPRQVSMPSPPSRRSSPPPPVRSSSAVPPRRSSSPAPPPSRSSSGPPRSRSSSSPP